MTYDDGNPNNLDQAIPDLEAHGFRGTFYLQTGRSDVQARAADWRKAMGNGHEIGNHTVRHPCRAGGYGSNIPSWLPPAIQLENFSPGDIRHEIDEAAEWLNNNIGRDPGRTFAHPCCDTAIGKPPDEASYDAAIKRHNKAARIGGNRYNDPAALNLLRIYGFYVLRPTAEAFIDICRQTQPGMWTVLMFHGIGGPSHTVERPVHQALLEFLSKQSAWVAPVRDVVAYLIATTRHSETNGR